MSRGIDPDVVYADRIFRQMISGTERVNRGVKVRDSTDSIEISISKLRITSIKRIEKWFCANIMIQNVQKNLLYFSKVPIMIIFSNDRILRKLII